ncbi:unnamed protein product [Schistosoma turkestanicum]|nr:unnamed protein product [Schistosoma turkestanicum]
MIILLFRDKKNIALKNVDQIKIDSYANVTHGQDDKINNHSSIMMHAQYNQPLNQQLDSLVDFPVKINPKAALNIISDIKTKRIGKRIVKRRKEISGESVSNDQKNVKIIKRRMKRIFERIHSKGSIKGGASLRVKQKKITKDEDHDSLKDWKRLIRDKKEDMKRVLIRRVKVKKNAVEAERESEKSRKRVIVKKIRRRVKKTADDAKERLRITDQLSPGQLKPMLKKTVVYKQAPSSNASDEYYDDEITETTWVLRLGDKNVTDKDMLDFINSQINGGTLLPNSSTNANTTNTTNNNNNSNAGKNVKDTETSWFSVPEKKNMNEKWISEFFDDDENNNNEIDKMLGKNQTSDTRQVVSKSLWISDDFEKQLKEMDFLGMLRNSTELNDIINRKSDLLSSFSLNDNSTTNDQIKLGVPINKV